jgi:hypothetical protein
LIGTITSVLTLLVAVAGLIFQICVWMFDRKKGKPPL